ncbi:MAG: serine hydrolase, partial [Pseudomonadota bacterium]
MPDIRKIAFGVGAVGALVLGGFGISHLNYLAKMVAGGKSHIVCNEVFLAGRDLKDILATELTYLPEARHLFSANVDYDKKTVTSGLGPLGRRTSVYREGYGCTLVVDKLVDVPPLKPIAHKAWKTASPSKYGIDGNALNSALDTVFQKAVDTKSDDHRAMVFIKRGELIAEHYAPGFDADTPMISQSMAKTVSQMMVGAAINEGLFNLDDRAPIEEWSAPDDPRRDITWRHLLQMQSGLEFKEDYLDVKDGYPVYATLTQSMAQYPIEKPLIHSPGTHWAYSTGTSQIIQRALRVALESKGVNYHSFGRDKIFEPLGASSVVFVPDSSGEFIGGSIVYATARDWAKLGQLFLQDGVWEGTQIFPEGWTAFVSSPASASKGIYGAQIWLNDPEPDSRFKGYVFPSLPASTYRFLGAEGQSVNIIPSMDMVVVHLGRTFWDDREFIPVNAALEVIAPTLQPVN